MTRRLVVLALVAAPLLACRVDRSITHGADGEREWTRRLQAAVPLHTAADAARALMVRNGFQCTAGADSVAHLSCEKRSGRTSLATRRWRAVLDLDSTRHVSAVRASTELVAP